MLLKYVWTQMGEFKYELNIRNYYWINTKCLEYDNGLVAYRGMFLFLKKIYPEVKRSEMSHLQLLSMDSGKTIN